MTLHSQAKPYTIKNGERRAFKWKTYHCPDYQPSTNVRNLRRLAQNGWHKACKKDAALRGGLNIVNGKITHHAWLKRSDWNFAKRLLC